MKNLEERKADFIVEVNGFAGKYDSHLRKDFCDYWTEHNLNARKMRFELSKNQPFNTNLRLAYWKRRSTEMKPKASESTDMQRKAISKLSKYD